MSEPSSHRINFIGFDRRIRLTWLDQSAETAGEILREIGVGKGAPSAALPAFRAAMNRAMAEEIRGRDARRKTINVLTRIWLLVPESHRTLRDEALCLWSRVPDAGRLWLHWGLTLLAYPFFRDVAATVGRLLRAQDRFTLAQVMREITARWGERTTLNYVVPRVIYSLVDWGVLEAMESERGIYQGTSARVSPHPELPIWLIEAVLRASPGEALPVYPLLHLPALFPFRLETGLEELHASRRFLIVRNGDGEPLVTIRTA